ncbi:tRNA (guanine(37)-N(1))-methyltransferase [Actinomadura yumaensis]|uniref:tRNA (guanine(37)-N(1))-methyltransferase n=1 Tax=Actinomadura yumaensis TaxID=111807 RepID=UPI003A94C149
MRIDIITIFPEYFAPLDVSLLGKARRNGLLTVDVHDLRRWTHDRHRTVDDTPYGGGPGMVMKPGPWGEALDTIAPLPHTPAPSSPQPPATPSDQNPVPAPTQAPASAPDQAPDPSSAQAPASASDQAPGPSSAQAPEPPAHAAAAADITASGIAGGDAGGGDRAAGGGGAPRLIVPTPSGRPFTQALAAEYASEPWLVFACGRYEGIDSRVVEEARTRMRVDEVSLGDFVLAGGEVAALVMIEAVGRLLPGVLGNADSVADDSFAPGAMESLLEGPVYTKPPVWRDRGIPDVLLSGHHGAIARWRRDEALRRTARNRPELLARLDPSALDAHDRKVLAEAGFPVDGEDMAH